jgi:hypothetical protein
MVAFGMSALLKAVLREASKVKNHWLPEGRPVGPSKSRNTPFQPPSLTTVATWAVRVASCELEAFAIFASPFPSANKSMTVLMPGCTDWNTVPLLTGGAASYMNESSSK